LIKALANTAIKASKSIRSKKEAIKKLEDPSNHAAPRSVRNKFKLTTIEAFSGHPEYKELVIKAETQVEQYKTNLTAIIKELADKELQWLKNHKIQLIAPVIAKINKCLLYRAKRSLGERPAAFNQWIVTEKTLPFLVLYWLMKEEQHHSQLVQRQNNFEIFFEMSFKEIIATAAHTMIEGPPTLAAKVLHHIEHTETCEWDILDIPSSNFMHLILPDLNEILTATLFHNVMLNEQRENAEIIDAETLAFARKLCTEDATTITQEALTRASERISNDSAEKQALNIRTSNLEKTLTNTRELLHTVINHQDHRLQHSNNNVSRLQTTHTANKHDNRLKNSTGHVRHPQATRRPETKQGQHNTYQRHQPTTGHPRFQPPNQQENRHPQAQHKKTQATKTSQQNNYSPTTKPTKQSYHSHRRQHQK